MALITCPECGNAVSDKAASCIHCGFPISSYLNYEPYPKMEDNFTPYTPRRPSTSPKHVQKSAKRSSATRAEHQRAKARKQKKYVTIATSALVLMLVIVAVTGVFNAAKNRKDSKQDSFIEPKTNSTVSTKSGKYPWSNVPYFQEYEPLINLYLNANVSEETTNALIDIVNSNKVIDYINLDYSHIDPRITYQEVFSSLKRNGCSIDFYCRESGEGYYILLVTHLPEEKIQYKSTTPILGLVEFFVNSESKNISIYSAAEIRDDGSIVSSNDTSLFGENDSYLNVYELEVATGDFNYDSRADYISAAATSLFEFQAGGYSLFTDEKGFPYAFASNGFMNENGSPIKIKDFESDIFMIYHEERHADNLFATYFETKYGKNSGYQCEYIGTTYNSFYVPEYDAYNCDIYKLISSRGKEEFYMIPFNVAGPIGVYTFSGKEIPTIWEYNRNTDKNQFLELVWTIDEAYNALFAQETTTESSSKEQFFSANVDSIDINLSIIGASANKFLQDVKLSGNYYYSNWDNTFFDDGKEIYSLNLDGSEESYYIQNCYGTLTARGDNIIAYSESAFQVTDIENVYQLLNFMSGEYAELLNYDPEVLQYEGDHMVYLRWTTNNAIFVISTLGWDVLAAEEWTWKSSSPWSFCVFEK